MVQKDDLGVEPSGKVFDSVIDNIRIVTPKAIKQKEIPLREGFIESVNEFFVVMFTQMISLSQSR